MAVKMSMYPTNLGVPGIYISSVASIFCCMGTYSVIAGFPIGSHVKKYLQKVSLWSVSYIEKKVIS